MKTTIRTIRARNPEHSLLNWAARRGLSLDTQVVVWYYDGHGSAAWEESLPLRRAIETYTDLCDPWRWSDKDRSWVAPRVDWIGCGGKIHWGGTYCLRFD